jgi:two-component system LytT family response regulator/two-component system response regulator LytT
MYTVIIVDDESPSRDELKFFLENQSNINIIAECDNGITALQKIKKMHPNIIFLDIQMPGKSGIEVAQQILKDDYIPAIIFVTAYDKYAIKAFDVNAIDYLLKPIEKKRLDIALNKAFDKMILKQSLNQHIEQLNSLKTLIKNKNKSKEMMISVYKNGKYYPIPSNEIIYIKVDGKYTFVITVKDNFMLHHTLSDIESIFNKSPFFKCHRSYIINTNYIETIDLWFNGTFQLKMKHVDESIPVSRGNAKEFRQMMHMF